MVRLYRQREVPPLGRVLDSVALGSEQESSAQLALRSFIVLALRLPFLDFLRLV